MSPRLGSRRRGAIYSIAAAAVVLGALGCQDAPLTGTPPQEPPRVDAGAGALMSGQVNADGSVTFGPAASSSAAQFAPGVSGAIYGDQNVTVRLYSSGFTIDSTSAPGKKRWSFSVGLRNYLDYPIGSNQAGAQPDDTLGVYVVVVADPVVTATSGPCSGNACKVRVDSTTDGVGSFTAPGQKYYYWRERLAAKQPVAGADTTSTRKRWVFTGPSTVSSFRFTLMVSAAWPPPHDTRWNVYYDAATDSLPDMQAEPRWKQYVIPEYWGFESPATRSWSASGLTMSASSGENLYLYRSDSISANESAYIEGQLSVRGSGSGNSTAGVAIGMIDPSHLIAIGVADGRVGFVSLQYDDLWILGKSHYRWEFVGTTKALQGNGGRSVHKYRLRKFAGDSARLELDGQRVLATRLSQLPARPDDAGKIRVFFGVNSYNQETPTSTWSHVTYNFGTSQP